MMLIIKFKKNKFKRSILLIKKTRKNHKSSKILEVLGNYNSQNNYLTINVFRLIYWISKNIYFSGDLLQILFLYNLIKIKTKKIIKSAI